MMQSRPRSASLPRRVVMLLGAGTTGELCIHDGTPAGSVMPQSEAGARLPRCAKAACMTR